MVFVVQHDRFHPVAAAEVAQIGGGRHGRSRIAGSIRFDDLAAAAVVSVVAMTALAVFGEQTRALSQWVVAEQRDRAFDRDFGRAAGQFTNAVRVAVGFGQSGLVIRGRWRRRKTRAALVQTRRP